MTFDGYAGRRLEILARDRARFAAGIVGELGDAVGSLGGRSVFVVTDSPWEDTYQTTCVELTSEGPAGKVIHDHH